MEIISYNKSYASAIRRLVAYFIDYFIFAVLLSPFGFITAPPSLFNWHGPYQWNFLNSDISFAVLISYLVWLTYFAVMESSKYQGTLGKIALGIKVVDKNNGRINLGTATLRNLSKLLSTLLLCIGFIMIIFDDRKQALHDKLADTFVVLK